jgi:hypothetical protein
MGTQIKDIYWRRCGVSDKYFSIFLEAMILILRGNLLGTELNCRVIILLECLYGLVVHASLLVPGVPGSIK